MVHQDRISLNTLDTTGWYDITPAVQRIVKKSGVSSGVVTVTSLHTTAAITVNENGDPDVELDLFAKLDKLIPRNESYYRHYEGNSDSHVKTSLIGNVQQVPFSQGKLTLGTWQSIYFCEFDGPRRNRQCDVTVIGE